jgi:hypothetical protein
MMFGRTQLAVMRSTVDRWFDTRPHWRAYQSALRLHEKGLLARDPKDSRLFTATERGKAELFKHDDALSERIAAK